MPNLDLKFYVAVFMRRLPYFTVIAVLITAAAVTVAEILPTAWRSQASILVEPQQIPGDLAQTVVPVNPYEQAQIIEQRLMTRVNLLKLADTIGLYAGKKPEMSSDAIVGDMHERINFLGFEKDETKDQAAPGATIIGVAFDGPTPQLATKGANELVSLVLQENVALRTGRAGDTLDFFRGEAQRLAGALAKKSQEIADFKTAHFEALPDSLEARRSRELLEQERLLALEREESDLKNQRATAIWVFQRTGKGATGGIEKSQEEKDLEDLRSKLSQQRTIFAPTSPTITLLEGRIAALEKLVNEQQAKRALPDAQGQPAKPMTELDLETAPIDARLKFIADEKATIQKTLDELSASNKATPENEMVLSGLERDLASLQTQNQEVTTRLAQAGIGERIEVLSKGERFSLIEPPNEPKAPVSPHRKLIAIAGLFGGMGAGIGFVALLELLNRSVRRPADLAAHLGIQPFATVPYIRTRDEMRWKRSVIGTVLVLVAVGIPAALFAVHTYYLPLDLLLAEIFQKLGLPKQF